MRLADGEKTGMSESGRWGRVPSDRQGPCCPFIAVQLKLPAPSRCVLQGLHSVCDDGPVGRSGALFHGRPFPVKRPAPLPTDWMCADPNAKQRLNLKGSQTVNPPKTKCCF
ncbi:unnamed protein product [Bursaphelenchus xylophilus]|nr:unnamed protein product [Bursaphelenchus xylophilus]CAG9107747.1 unnamed protein product [Bursaphelenchus xylophilus]